MGKPTEKTSGRKLEEATFPLISEIRDLVRKARLAVAQNINTIQVVTNFEIGRRIVEHEQQGDPKAGYGKQTIQELSRQLNEEFGTGWDITPRVPRKNPELELFPSYLYKQPAYFLLVSQPGERVFQKKS